MGQKKAELNREEQIILELRGLYEQLGYEKYKMGSFEEYSLYADNKDFLGNERVITFTDLDGRLLALKPDITLGIIKNSKATDKINEKLYYIENVYRESQESHNFKEINQMGLEFMGNPGEYEILEVLWLAARTLEAVSPNYILELSHMSFATEILKQLKVSEELKFKFLRLIRSKNVSGLAKTAQSAGLSKENQDLVCAVPLLYGTVAETIEKAKPYVLNKEMQESLDKLEELEKGLNVLGVADRIQIDLSTINDIDYYNGIIFKGYVEGLPRRILAGGQYDSAMERMGRSIGAIGFALYLNELNRIITPPSIEIDALILYEEGSKASDLAGQVMKLYGEGKSVRVERFRPKALKFKTVYTFGKTGLQLQKEEK